MAPLNLPGKRQPWWHTSASWPGGAPFGQSCVPALPAISQVLDLNRIQYCWKNTGNRGTFNQNGLAGRGRLKLFAIHWQEPGRHSQPVQLPD